MNKWLWDMLPDSIKLLLGPAEDRALAKGPVTEYALHRALAHKIGRPTIGETGDTEDIVGAIEKQKEEEGEGLLTIPERFLKQSYTYTPMEKLKILRDVLARSRERR